jgi:DNA-binding XRE family transcriptional regulator
MFLRCNVDRMTERDLILLRQVRADAKSGRAREVRMDAGVTQSELGAATGVHQATIALWELGHRSRCPPLCQAPAPSLGGRGVSAGTRRRVWTAREVLALGTRTDVPTAYEILTGRGRDAAYRSVKRGDFPVPVIHIGDRQMIVPVQPILELLGLADRQAS